MAKLKNIPFSYYSLLMEEIGIKERATYHENRVETCHDCSNGSNKCPECGCPLKALISGPKDNCELNKWEQ